MELSCYTAEMNDAGFMSMAFGDAMRFRREQLGYTQADLAKLLGRGQSTIVRWEKSIKPPKDLFALQQLAEALRMDVEDLRTGRIHVGTGLTTLDAAREATMDELIKRLARASGLGANVAEKEELIRLLLRLDAEDMAVVLAQVRRIDELHRRARHNNDGNNEGVG